MPSETGEPIEFRGEADETAYLEWMEEHHDRGYVANLGRPKAGQATLHGADCGHVWGAGLDATKNTKRPKVCGLDRERLVAVVGLGHAVVACASCGGETKAGRAGDRRPEQAGAVPDEARPDQQPSQVKPASPPPAEVVEHPVKPDDYSPVPSEWFTTEATYHGVGRAEFADPEGWVEGPASVRFDESGEQDIVMEVARFGAEDPLPLGLHQLLSGAPVSTDAAAGTVSLTPTIDSGWNRCERLSVESPDGVFSATDGITFSNRINWSADQQERTTLSFRALRSRFDAKGAGSPRYWVLPLTNFLSRFRRAGALLHRHPLRIFPTPDVPPEVAASDWRPKLVAQSRHRLITFGFANGPGFIEALHDYDERRRRLLAGRDRRLITAVMVGDVGERAKPIVDAALGPPADFLLLLGLATGREVGSPWLELRSGDGGLVARLHEPCGNPIFTRGRAAIDEAIHGGTGALLDAAQTSDVFGGSTLRVVLKHVIRGGAHDLTIEDSLSYFFRALDNLGKARSVPSTVRARQVLDPRAAGLVKAALDGAGRVVGELIKQARREGDDDRAAALERIRNTVAGAETWNRGFGRVVVDLVLGFGFADADVVARHLEAHPRADRRGWAAALADCRGTVMHRGYLDLADPRVVGDVASMEAHLHDLLIRMCLKMLRYPGTYQPAVESWTVEREVDWVKPDTDPCRLGYGRAD